MDTVGYCDSFYDSALLTNGFVRVFFTNLAIFSLSFCKSSYTCASVVSTYPVSAVASIGPPLSLIFPVFIFFVFVFSVLPCLSVAFSVPGSTTSNLIKLYYDSLGKSCGLCFQSSSIQFISSFIFQTPLRWQLLKSFTF